MSQRRTTISLARRVPPDNASRNSLGLGNGLGNPQSGGSTLNGCNIEMAIGPIIEVAPMEAHEVPTPAVDLELANGRRGPRFGVLEPGHETCGLLQG